MADVLTQLKTFLPAAFAEDVHARAEDLLQARAASVAAPVDEALLADSFEFVGPVVGPLSKSAFVNAIGSVDLSLIHI